MDLTAAEVIERVTTLEQDYNVFRGEAEDKTDLYALRRIPELPDDLARDSQINILSPDLRWAAHTVRSQCLTFPTEVNCIPTAMEPSGSVSAADKRKADNVERGDTIFWSKLNEHRRIDRPMYWRQCVQPLACFIFECGPVSSPDPAKRWRYKCFDVPLDTIGWLEEDDQATYVGRRYKQILAHCQKEYSRRKGNGENENKDLVWANGKFDFEAASDSFSPRLARSTISSKGFEEVELAWYDDGDEIYVVGMNSPTSWQSIKGKFGLKTPTSGEILWKGPNTIGRPSLFLVPSNDTPLTNPEDKYESFLDPLATVIEQQNVMATIRATASRNRAAPRDYIHIPPEVALQYLKGPDGKMPSAAEWADGRTEYFPGEIKQRPIDVDPDMDKLDVILEGRAQRYRPQNGAQLADPQVLANATAAGILESIDANVLLLAPLLGAGDNFRKQILEAYHADIKYTAEHYGEKYSVHVLAADGASSVKGQKMDAGTLVEMSWAAIDFPHSIKVSTSSLTQAQSQAKYEIARAKMEPLPDGSPGVGTREDLYQAANIPDATAQRKQQAKEMILSAADQTLQQEAMAAIHEKFLIDSGMDLPGLIPPPVVQPPTTLASPAAPASAASGAGGGQGNHTTSPATEPAQGGSGPTML